MVALYEGVGVIRQLNVDIAPTLQLSETGPVILASDHAAELVSLRASLAAAESKLAEAVKRSTALEESLRAMLPENNQQERYLRPTFETCERARALLAKHEGDGL